MVPERGREFLQTSEIYVWGACLWLGRDLDCASGRVIVITGRGIGKSESASREAEPKLVGNGSGEAGWVEGLCFGSFRKLLRAGIQPAQAKLPA